MPKRKRGDYVESNLSKLDDRRLEIQIARLEQKLGHGCQLIHRALKTARGFERQKLGRRQKTAKQTKETAQLSRIEEEIQALKGLDLGITAERHLLKHLVKTKRIAESPAFTRLSSKKPVPEGPKSGPEANVIARLFKSNPVRDVLPGIINSIRGILGIVDGLPTEKANGNGIDTTRPNQLRKVKVESRPKRQQDFNSDLEMGDADMEQYNDRLAPSSDSESELDDREQTNDRGLLRHSARFEPSVSPESYISSSNSMPEMDTTSSKANNKNQETVFLPSLTMGGYWSGSESAEEDAAAVAIQPRKNRMGQQARRKLWEKKFGSGANHLKNQPPEKEKSRDSGWDMRKGATSRDETGGKRGKGRFPGAMSPRKPKDERVARAPNPIFEQRGAALASEQKPLHPSWEAAKKAKEQKSKIAFQGKKIVFD
ncbi:hypothetical protein AJ78_00729 [Emergomyces pasteurianus Ep9510]|uniref:Bud22 domain-containing protein n=1 Tax=Emergomyces pasteurianus Ep9510 TaxID=1447872 RepID=A0A1J9PS67_9EURO|nr:hypothetical protein AJ78_00729 [Emergomyces pasteurianus Ep9510]